MLSKEFRSGVFLWIISFKPFRISGVDANPETTFHP